MDQLEKKIAEAIKYEIKGVDVRGEGEFSVDIDMAAIKQALKDDGWVRIPSSQGKSVTIYTSDNPEPLMTEQEWREKNG